MLLSRMISLMMAGISMAACLQAQQLKAQTPAAAKSELLITKTDYPLDSLTEFSAIMVGSLMGNNDELRIYRSGDLMRTEMLDGNHMVTNLKTYKTFVVLPTRCVQDARPSVNTFPFTAVRPGHKVERQFMGSEVVEGHNCQIEDITITSERGLPLKLRFWEAFDLNGFPIKLEVHRMTGSPVTIRYKDVKIGRPDPALFQHPSNCKLSQQPGVKGAVKLSAPKPPEKSQR